MAPVCLFGHTWPCKYSQILTPRTVYRLNTYPFIHLGFFHAFLNILALTPLLERFEAEHGTLTAVALFIGRKLPLGVLWDG